MSLSLRTRRLLALALVVCWSATLALPAMTIIFDQTPQLGRGWQVLVFGWVGATYFQFAWYANPVFAAVVVGLIRTTTSRRWFRVTGFALLATTASTAQLFIWPAFNKLGGIHVGLYLWVAVNIVAGITALLLSRAGSLRPRGEASDCSGRAAGIS